MVGSLEAATLAAIERLRPGAYCANIARSLQEIGLTEIRVSSVGLALARLESKGMAYSKFGGQEATRGGRSRRLYEITRSGREALQRVREAVNG